MFAPQLSNNQFLTGVVAVGTKIDLSELLIPPLELQIRHHMLRHDQMKDFSAAISFKLDEIRTSIQQRGALKRRPMTATTHVSQGAVCAGYTTTNTTGNTGIARQGGQVREGERGPGESNVGLAHLYGNRGLVYVCLGDDASALDDLDHAVARDTRNIT